MIDNRQLLSDLFARGKVHAQPAPLLQETVGAQYIAPERIEGMLLGVAIGDALGATSESKNADVRLELYGEIHDYTPNRYTHQSLGYPTDDTQLTF